MRCRFVAGGYVSFEAAYPHLCESRAHQYKATPHVTVSLPCLSSSEIGPTRIAPHVYIGSLHDALSRDTLEVSASLCLPRLRALARAPVFVRAHPCFSVPARTRDHVRCCLRTTAAVHTKNQ